MFPCFNMIECRKKELSLGTRHWGPLVGYLINKIANLDLMSIWSGHFSLFFPPVALYNGPKGGVASTVIPREESPPLTGQRRVLRLANWPSTYLHYLYTIQKT